MDKIIIKKQSKLLIMCLENLLLELAKSLKPFDDMPVLLDPNPKIKDIINEYQEVSLILNKAEVNYPFMIQYLFDRVNILASIYVLQKEKYKEEEILKLQNNKKLKTHYEKYINKYVFAPLYKNNQKKLIEHGIKTLDF